MLQGAERHRIGVHGDKIRIRIPFHARALHGRCVRQRGDGAHHIDAVSREFNIDIQLAKDCGSLAVLISILLGCGVWLLAIVERAGGLAG